MCRISLKFGIPSELNFPRVAELPEAAAVDPDGRDPRDPHRLCPLVVAVGCFVVPVGSIDP
jgi:hypothetical protein